MSPNANREASQLNTYNGKFDRVLENDIVELKNDMADVKAALREKGII